MRCVRRHSTLEAAMVFTWDPSLMLFIHRKFIVCNQIHKSSLGMQIALQSMGSHASPEIVLASSGGFMVGHLPGLSH